MTLTTIPPLRQHECNHQDVHETLGHDSPPIHETLGHSTSGKRVMGNRVEPTHQDAPAIQLDHFPEIGSGHGRW